MAKKTIILNRFDGGVTDDLRIQSPNSFAMARHFDIHSYPQRLKPYTSLALDETIGADTDLLQDYRVRNFLLASNSKLYGLGQAGTADDDPKILRKDTVIGGAWVAVADAEETAGAVQREVFIEYKDNLMYSMLDTTSKLRRFDFLAGSPAIVAVGNLAAAPTGQALIGRDDNLYIPSGRYLNKVTSAWAISTVLTLPSNLSITSITKYGNYLALAAESSSNAQVSPSRLFLWDYVSPDVIESVDLGIGACKVLENVEGQLIAILAYGLGNAFGNNAPKIVFRRYVGGTPVTIREITVVGSAGSAAGYLTNFKHLQDNRLFFAADLPQTASSTEDEGIWSIGRKSEGYPWAITLDVVSPSSATVTGMYSAGNYWWLATGTANVYATSNSTYGSEPSYETIKLNGGDVNRPKKLIGVAVAASRIGSDVSMVLKYKRDKETSWTTIATNSNLDSTNFRLSREHLLILSTGKNLGEFYEVQFRVETTGGVELLALKVQYEELPGLLETK